MVDQQGRSPSLVSTASSSHITNSANSTTDAIKQSSSAPRAAASQSLPKPSDAVLAALSAGRSTRSPAQTSTFGTTGTSIDVAKTQPIRSQQTMNGRQLEARSNTLAAPSDQHNVPKVKSPSHAAALAAAARGTARAEHGPTTLKRQTTQPLAKSQTKPTVAAKPRRLSLQNRQLSTSTFDSPTDTTSIAPTTSLVSLFEQKSSPVAKEPPRPLVITRTNSIPLASPKPLRSSDGFRTILQDEMGNAGRVQDIPHASHEEKPRKEDFVLVASKQADRDSPGHREDRPGPHNGSRHNRFSASVSADTSQRNSYSSPGASQGDSLRKVGTTSESESRGRQGGQGRLVRATTQEAINAGRRVDEADKNVSTRQKAPPLPPRTSVANTQRTDSIPKSSPARAMPQPISRPSTAPIDIRVTPNERKPSQDTLSTSAQSNRSVNATYRFLYPKQSTSLTRDDDLANAIVASSLASSRLSSPQRRDLPPVPPSRGHSRHGRSLFHSRTPSPTKGGGLRQTLRKQDSSSSDGEDDTHPYGKHHKKRLIRKHPNKHHEGDRKRWRDAVTEGERKRYEGVWAANKGLHMPPLPQDPTSRMDPNMFNEQVSNIVTKDIWSRSRLPDFELETVWDLVDSEGVGRLSKEEFVVGMWLIDQRLKGRKLPVKVTPTVWTSVRALHGIKVRK